MIQFTQKYFRAYRLEVQSIENRPDPSEPTEHWCGSKAKIEIMRERRARGESIFHPLDAKEIINHHDNDVETSMAQCFDRFDKHLRQPI